MATSENLRTERFPSGIASVGLSTIERQIPADEPPPLPPTRELSVIGKSFPRPNGRAKVTGAARFTVDIKLPGMLHARVLRSPWPHALVRSIDVSAAANHLGVRAILQIVDPASPQNATLRYVGAPVAAVAAVSMAAAEEALHVIRVDYQTLPFVTDLNTARNATAPLVHDDLTAPAGHPSGFPAAANLPLNGNVRGPAIARRGDVTKGFTEADTIVEAEYSTCVQTHCCLEPHAIVADWRPDGVTVYMSTQFTAGVRDEIAEAFGLPLNSVRVIVDAMGGGFGSKSQLGNYGHCAIELSRRAAAPVQLFLEREEEQMDAGNRPGTWQRLRIGAKRDGSLTAISLVSYGSAGVDLGAGVGNNAEALYSCSNFEGAQHDVFINGGQAARCVGPEIRRALSASNSQSMRWPKNSASIRSSCATASTPVPCGAKNGASGPSGLAGNAGTLPAPPPATSSAALVWRNRCGAPTCRPTRPAKCASCATARSRCSPASRTSAPASRPYWRKPSPKCSGFAPMKLPSVSAIPTFRLAGRLTAAPPPRR